MSNTVLVLTPREQKTPASAGTSRDNHGAQMWTEQHSTCRDRDRDSAAGTACSSSPLTLLPHDIYSTLCSSLLPSFSPRGLLCPVFFVQTFLTALHFFSRWKRSVSLYGSFATGNWREGYFIGDPERYVQDRLWKWEALSIGATLGNLEVGRLPWTSSDGRRWALVTERLSMAALLGGIRREGSFGGEPGGYIKEGSGKGHFLT